MFLLLLLRCGFRCSFLSGCLLRLFLIVNDNSSNLVGHLLHLLFMHNSTDIRATSVASLRNIYNLVLVHVSRASLSVDSSVKRFIIMELVRSSFGSLQDRTVAFSNLSMNDCNIYSLLLSAKI